MGKKSNAARIFTAFVGKFLLFHGVVTLIFRLCPPLDRAFPFLLAITQISAQHSLLHIATGLLAVAILRWGNARDCIFYAALVGVAYAFLGAYCMATMHPTFFALQLFDHPFHMLIGLSGLATAAQSALPQVPSQAE